MKTSAKHSRRGERGATLMEFVVTAALFFMMLVAIVAGGVLFYTHNALVEATRRGARYAVLQCNPSDTSCPNYAASLAATKNVVVYGTPTPADGQTTLIPNLTTDNVSVTTPGLGVREGSVTVSITSYQYPLVIPFISMNINMPPYSTMLTGESAGYIPANK